MISPMRDCFARFASIAVAVCTLVPARGVAQSTPPETPPPTLTTGQIIARRALLERAQAAARANDHVQALSLAQQASAIEMTVSLRMFLAQQQQALGHHTAAMEYSEQCVREALRNTTLERRDIIIAECRRISATSQPQLVLATVTVPTGLRPEFSVRIGNRRVETSEFNLPIAIDPGEGELVATAPGVETHTERFRGLPGSTISLVIPARFQAASPMTTTTGQTTGTASTGTTTATANTGTTAGTTTTGTATAGTTTALTTVNAATNGTTSNVSGAGASQTANSNVGRGAGAIVPPPAERSGGVRIGAGPWVVLGLGAATLGSAGVFFALRNGQFANCRPMGAEILCDSEQAAAQWRAGTTGASAYTFHNAMNGTLIGGGVLMAAGLTWLIVNVARSPRAEQAATASLRLHYVGPQMSAQAVGLGLGGTF